MDDISEKMDYQITSEILNKEITIVYESTSKINENESVSQIDHDNSNNDDQTEQISTDEQVNDKIKNTDSDIEIQTTDIVEIQTADIVEIQSTDIVEIQNTDIAEIQNTDIEIISKNDNVNNHNSTVQKEKELPHEILENCNRAYSSLHAIAIEYNSDTDNEDDVCIDTDKHVDLCESDSDKSIEVLFQGSNSEYRTKEEESSSSEDSDSDSSDSSDSSVIVTSNDSDDSSNRKKRTKKNKEKPKTAEVKSELDYLPPIEDLKISVSEDSCDPIGEVAWTVEQLVVVRPKVGKPTLNLDTVLFIDKGKRALGTIFDVFGQVADPHYCVRFNSTEHIKKNEIEVGMTVYYCPNTPYTTLVFVHELTKVKASDAVGDDEAPDFSDDEEERQYYENLKKKQVPEVITLEENVPQKKRRKSIPTWQSNHPWNRNAKAQNFRGRNPHGKNSDCTVHPATPISHNSWSWSSPSYQNGSQYPPHFQQMYPANNGLYEHMSYSNNTQVDSTYQNPSNCDKYNYGTPYRNCTQKRLPLLSPDPVYGIPLGVHAPLPIVVNRHDTLSSPNTRFPHANMYWQSQPQQVIPPWSLLSPPPPPPLAEESRDTPQ